jgi:hypothetical protein
LIAVVPVNASTAIITAENRSMANPPVIFLMRVWAAAFVRYLVGVAIRPTEASEMILSEVVRFATKTPGCQHALPRLLMTENS